MHLELIKRLYNNTTRRREKQVNTFKFKISVECCNNLMIFTALHKKTVFLKGILQMKDLNDGYGVNFKTKQIILPLY